MGCKDSLESVVKNHRVKRGEMVGTGGRGIPVLTGCSPLICCLLERSLIFTFSAESSAVNMYPVWWLMDWTSWNR